MKMVKYKRPRWIAIAVYSLLITGCGHFSILRYGPDRQSREAFERRVEAAFRLQNHMTSEVMVLQEVNTDDQNEDAILHAEQVMQNKCRYLNEYASKEIDEINIGFLLLSRVEDSVAACEAAARNLDVLLKNRQGL